jgi:hypothetical protein
MWDLCDSCGLPLNPVQTARLPTMHASDDQPVTSQDSVRAEVRSGRTSRLSKRQPMHVTVCMSACCPLQLTPNAEAATGNGKPWSFLLSHASTLCVAGETCRSPCAEVRGLMLHSMRRRRRLDRPCAAMHVPLTCHFPGTRIPSSNTFDHIDCTDKNIVCCGARHILLASIMHTVRQACRMIVPCHVHTYIYSTRQRRLSWPE